MLVLGLMSGTSGDGVDAVLANFWGLPNKPYWKILNRASIKYSHNLQKTIIQTQEGLSHDSQHWLELSELITEAHVAAANACDPEGFAQLIGCHGQTVWHQPPNPNKQGKSLQIIQAPLLSRLVKRPVIYDFRAADIALGGQGAPLVPKTDEALLGRGIGWRSVLNLGGIANITLIPPKNGPDSFSPILGWDCGPANSLIDLAVRKLTKDKLTFDCDGEIAKQGKPDEDIIKEWLKESFFTLSPPKSIGREKFGLKDLDRRIDEMRELSFESQIATLTAFSAAVVANDLERICEKKIARPTELLVAGGGEKNKQLMKELKKRCLGTRVISSKEKGVPSLSREALAFALLAWWHIRKYPGNSPAITGARDHAVLGVKVQPSN